jgi:hypothetical protein
MFIPNFSAYGVLPLTDPPGETAHWTAATMAE